MKPCTWKRSPLVIAFAAALCACSSDNTRSDVAYERDETVESRPAPAPRAAPTAAPAPKRAPVAPAASPSGTADAMPAPLLSDDELIGVEACDDYLETYRSCHRVLGMYPADTLEARFQSLRAGLAKQANDAAGQAALKAQCESLAADMSTALDGRDCPDEDNVAADSTLEDAIGDDKPDSR